MVTQTFAMVLDAYRELNSKKLFWITMGLSAIVVGVFGAVGFDESGFSIFWKHFRSPYLNTTFLPIAELYKNLFITLGVQWWLGYFALILALISTAPMFPDFLSGGAVDLYLARPLGRVRLFMTKYLVGMLFVALQVAVFCAASFIVIGIRGKAWVPGIFLAIPVVVLMFSYLWSICALVGTLTRSTIAALLLTMLAWLLIFGIKSAEATLLTFSTGSKIEAQAIGRDIERIEKNIADFRAKLATTQPTPGDEARLKTMNATLDFTRASRGSVDDPFASWHKGLYTAYWLLPKTSETTTLMERWLDRQFRPPHERGRNDQVAEDEPINRNFFANREVQRLTVIEVEKQMRSRSVGWVIGTSLLFEAAMLGLAALVFVRRDF
jgi:ABC-type transport system involved in multi-copper enzyme maturation permease subunit